MKNNLILPILCVFLVTLMFGCKKDNTNATTETPQNQLQSTERDGGSSYLSQQTLNGATQYTFSSESSLDGGREGEAFCCDVEWVGFQNLPFPPFTAGFQFTFRRYNVPGANAYRTHYTVFRNDFLFWTGSFPDTGDANCPTINSSLVWPNGLGNCCGVFSITMSLQYRIGTTWYTCDSDHGEMNYFPPGCGWCE